ncbi:hypothetical protein [Bacillus timonensis]|uniref:hypothetical protein n=1 Tax=Bacillus timonensis TaxID=1033734 RepID=UPI0002895616|nr:hypothetical protein [Bacillus timonensis]
MGKKEKLFISNSTGQVLDVLEPGDSIIKAVERERRKQAFKQIVENIKKQNEMQKYFHQKRWIASYNNEILELTKKLNLETAGAALKATLYMNMNSNGRLDTNGRPIKRLELHNIFAVKKSQAQNYIRILSSDEVKFLVVDKATKPYTYYINKKYHTMGTEIKDGRHFVKIFKEKTKELLDGVKLRHLGMLYILLPYFHFQSGYLCLNPSEDVRLDGEKSFFRNWIEETIKEIEHFTEEELSKVLGRDIETIVCYLKELSNAGFLMYSHSNGVFTIKIRPDIMISVNSEKVDFEYYSFVMAEFNQNIKKKNQVKNKVNYKVNNKVEEKVENNLNLLKQLLKNNPNAKKTELAKAIGVSRGHIYRLLKKI